MESLSPGIQFLHVRICLQYLEEEGEEEEELPGAKVPKADVGDLRELLRRKNEPSGLFSSADAFIPFSEDDEGEELIDAEVDVAEVDEAVEDTPPESNGGQEIVAADVDSE